MKLKDLQESVARSKRSVGPKPSSSLQYVDEIYVEDDAGTVRCLTEGKWYSGRFERNIRQDPPAHGVGQTHAHIHGLKGNEIGVVKLDGTGSHGTKMKLHKKDADALTARGFNIRPDRIVEWIEQKDCELQFLLG